MSNPFKNLIRKTALKAQETFNIDEEKTQKFLDATNRVIDKTSEKFDQVEQATNGLEGNLKERLQRAKEAFVNPDFDKPQQRSQAPQADVETPKPVTTKSVRAKTATKKASKKVSKKTTKTVAKKTSAKKMHKP